MSKNNGTCSFCSRARVVRGRHEYGCSVHVNDDLGACAKHLHKFTKTTKDQSIACPNTHRWGRYPEKEVRGHCVTCGRIMYTSHLLKHRETSASCRRDRHLKRYLNSLHWLRRSWEPTMALAGVPFKRHGLRPYGNKYTWSTFGPAWVWEVMTKIGGAKKRGRAVKFLRALNSDAALRNVVLTAAKLGANEEDLLKLVTP